MKDDGIIGFPTIFAIGILIVLIAGYFSPPGLKSVLTMRYWSVVIGAVIPAILFFAWSFVNRTGSDDYPLLFIFVVLVLMSDCFVGLIAGFYLGVPASYWLRICVGATLGAVAMVLTLLLK